MKRTLLLFMVLLSFGVLAQNGEKNFIDQNYIEVTGKAEMEVVPDEIYLAISIDEEDSNSKVSLEEKERQMFKALASIGIDLEKDLTIKDFASNFKDFWLKKSKIQTRKEYQLLVHDSPTLSKVFLKLEEKGISNISIEKLDHSRLEDLTREVKVKAIKDAKEKAEYLATAIGQSAERAIYVQEYNTGYQPRMYDQNIMIRGASSMKMESTPVIEFQKIKLESSVLVRFELN